MTVKVSSSFGDDTEEMTSSTATNGEGTIATNEDVKVVVLDDDGDVGFSSSLPDPPPATTDVVVDLRSQLAGVAGNVIEWYDFSCFGYFSDVFAANFFPEDRDFRARLISSFVIFGAAYVVRPIGGMVIGRLGDARSRAFALRTAITFMVLPTFCLGCLPTYDVAGPVATVLLVILRLAQGLSAGGQGMSAVVFLMERTPRERWGFWGATVLSASNLGVSLGSAMSYALRQTLDDDQLRRWGWRIPFWFALLGVVPSFYLDSAGPGHQHRPSASPESRSKWYARSNWRSLVACALAPCMPAAFYYVTYVWLATYMETIRDPPTPHAFGVNTMVGLFSLLLQLGGGWTVDALGTARGIGYEPVMYAALALVAVVAPVALTAVSRSPFGSVPVLAFAAQALCGTPLALYYGALLPFLVSIFPKEVRLTSMAVGFNVAVCAFGGFAPALSTWLVGTNLGITSVGLYVTALCALSALGVWLGNADRWREGEEDVDAEDGRATPDGTREKRDENDKELI